MFRVRGHCTAPTYRQNRNDVSFVKQCCGCNFTMYKFAVSEFEPSPTVCTLRIFPKWISVRLWYAMTSVEISLEVTRLETLPCFKRRLLNCFLTLMISRQHVIYFKRRPPSYKPGGFWRSLRHSNLISYKKINFIISNE